MNEPTTLSAWICEQWGHQLVKTRRAKAPGWLSWLLFLDYWWPRYEIRWRCWNCDLDQPANDHPPP